MDAILYIYQNKDKCLIDNLEENVYKIIAIKSKKTQQNVKTSIIKATNLVYLYQDKQVLEKYFKINMKPTPKVVIATILNKIELV